MAKKIHLLTIDPQNSFCKIVDAASQQTLHDGELCVPGAWDDMVRLAGLIKRLGRRLDDIHVTLDSHHFLHIAHPIWFKDFKGRQPDPFTLMREENGIIIGTKYDATGPHDVGEFTTFSPNLLPRTLKYLKALATGKRYPHCIWPSHCLIGSPGYAVVAPLYEALHEWERDNFAAVDFVTKGSNFYCEHFSAVQAEVPDPDDPSTQINMDLINTINEADEIIGGGEALSHCFANTVRDAANTFKDDNFIKKFTLLTDATSNVPGFENYGTDFITEMTARGMKTCTCADYLN